MVEQVRVTVAKLNVKCVREAGRKRMRRGKWPVSVWRCAYQWLRGSSGRTQNFHVSLNGLHR